MGFFLSLFLFIFFAVCRATIEEMKIEIKKVDPRKKVEVSGFRMTADGNSISKSVQLIRSETYLTELMETICEYIAFFFLIKTNF